MRRKIETPIDSEHVTSDSDDEADNLFWRSILPPKPAIEVDMPLPVFTTAVDHGLRENRSEEVWEQVRTFFA